MAPRAIILLSTLALLTLPSCQTTRYYSQAAGGQFEILAKSRPIEVVVKRKDLSPQLRAKLLLTQDLLTFADRELSLPPGTAYSTYADLGREHVVWSLYAAPRLSLEPKRWRYPVVGKLSYRGFFSEPEARKAAQALEAQGYDTLVAGVDAYSTLGWFRDPVLNTFIEDPEILLAELIFHELTHRKIFRKGETAFNEALATAVAQEGVQRWLSSQGREGELASYRALLKRRQEFYRHVNRTRQSLARLYRSDRSEAEKIRRKTRLLAALQEDFRDLHRRWGTRGSTHWLDQPLNNAHLVASATYHHHLPVFEELLATHPGDLPAFFRAVKRLPPLEMNGPAPAPRHP